MSIYKNSFLSKILFVAVIFFALVGIKTFTVMAAGATVEVLSTDSADTGDEVSVTVSISGGSISAYTVYVTYDASVLKFNSGSGATLNGGDGTVVISGTAEANVSLSFTAADKGESGIYTSGEFYDLDMNEIDTSYGSSYIEVGGEEPTEEDTTEKTTKKTTEATEDNRSSNCNLYTLEVSEGTLTPEFNTSTTYYEMRVAEDVTYIEVSAYPSDNKASVSVRDNDNIEPGENHIYITVTAENGDSRVYTIRVIAGEFIGDKEVTVNGTTYRFYDDYYDIYDYINIPDGYEEIKAKYDKWEIPAFSYGNKNVLIVCLRDGQDNICQFVYDEKNQKFYRYVEYFINDHRYLITDMHEDVALGDGFTEAVLKIEGEEIRALKSDDLDKDCYIVYAFNLSGESGLYIFDDVEGNMMRYNIIPTPTDATPDDASSEDTEEIKTEEPTTENPLSTEEEKNTGVLTKKQFLTLLIIVGAVFLILIILIIFFAFRFKAIKAEQDEEDETEKFVDELWKLDGGEAATDEKESFPDDETQAEAVNNGAKEDDTENKDDAEITAGKSTDIKEDNSLDLDSGKKNEDAGKAADEGKKEKVTSTDNIDELTKKIDKLIEANQAMWSENKEEKNQEVSDKKDEETKEDKEEQTTDDKTEGKGDEPEETKKKKKSSFEIFDAD